MNPIVIFSTNTWLHLYNSGMVPVNSSLELRSSNHQPAHSPIEFMIANREVISCTGCLTNRFHGDYDWIE